MNRIAVAQELVKIAGLLSEMRVLRKQSLGSPTAMTDYIFQLPVVKRGTMAQLNSWAKSQGFTFIRDSSLFRGHYSDPITGDSFLFDTM